MMADSCAWIIGDDGSLGIGDESASLTYHAGLNVVIVATKSNSVKVIDIPSGVVLRDCKLSGKNGFICITVCIFICANIVLLKLLSFV